MAATGASGAWDWDVSADKLHTDARFAELYGLDPEAAIAGLPTSAFFQAIHPDDRARIRIAVAGVLAGAELFSKEFRVATPDESILWMHARGQCHRDEHDEIIGFSGVLVDVTERKRTEERLRIAQTAGGVGTFEYIDGFATAMVSEEFCRLLGLHPASSLPIQTINGVVKPGQSQLIPDPRSGAIPDELEAIFQIVRNDDGADRWIARRGEILPERGGYRLVGVIYDVTAAKEQEAELRELNDTLETRVEHELAIRRQAEDALRQAQKMEAVGQLTGGIAHDFNNLLMAISSSLSLLKKRIPDDPQLHRMIENALQGTQRGAALTQRMLAFARRQDLKPEPVDIAALVDGMRVLLEHTLGPAWTLQLEFPDDLPAVVADANQLEMAILNLSVNARDAMADGGKICIAAEQENVLDDRIPDLAPGRYLKVSVIDSGSGMDIATLERATEPFFTTKGIGKGTGLGLSMIDGLAKQLHGTFTLTSDLGNGTTATLWLPASDEDPVSLAVSSITEVSDRACPLKILAVDDDALILMNTVDLLADLGHDVFEASSGQSALDFLREHPDVELLITDQAMPHMTGTQLAELARENNPDLAIILATGYGELPRDAQAKIVKLGKPFDQDELAKAVTQAMQISRN
ncbi:hybrid sensor histidine kinase/response regulator [Novosphingobium sp. G106]|uniref:hybrid sensor histidine kinase/response regulator n=1 Tax=Novosphingobium sp. G106 TaxID=2849500 RepID=UPI0020C20807|nr:hybrid sensor histidine kinase/response regulator [Novosphingobium sp. G106]